MATLNITNCSSATSRMTSSISELSVPFSPSLFSQKVIKLKQAGLSSQSLRFQRKSYFHHHSLRLSPLKNAKASPISAAATSKFLKEVLPPALDSTSEPPPIFDGTTRPDWYKEKVYPTNKVPSLEHNNEVRGESLDLIKYIDSRFEGPSLSPDDPAKKEFAEELFTYTDLFSKTVRASFKEDGTGAGSAFDYIETALSKFNDGPFFLGQFSLVDIAYAPFIERYQAFLLEVHNYDITASRPKLAAWTEEMNKNEGFNETRRDPKEHVEIYKKHLAG